MKIKILPDRLRKKISLKVYEVLYVATLRGSLGIYFIRFLWNFSGKCKAINTIFGGIYQLCKSFDVRDFGNDWLTLSTYN